MQSLVDAYPGCVHHTCSIVRSACSSRVHRTHTLRSLSRPVLVCSEFSKSVERSQRQSQSTRGSSLVTKALVTPPEVTKTSDSKPAQQETSNSREDAEQSSNLWSLVSDTTSAITSQLYGQLRFWPDTQAVDGKVQQRGLKPSGQVLKDASESIREEHARKLPADISDLLQVNDVKTLRLLRLLSSLCGITYKMHLVTPSSMHRRFRLDLVTTSRACEVLALPTPTSQQAEEVVADSDGMAASIANVQDVYFNLSCLEENNIVALPKDVSLELITADKPAPPAPKSVSSSWNPADLVQQKLTEAAAAASAAAIAPLGSAAAKLYKATQTLMTSTIPAPAVYLSAKLAIRAEAEGLSDAQAVCPSEWFVCDDVERGVRYFVIQGSNTIDHWKCNLTFDPVVFEDPALGAKVHRGVYYAALALYERFLPLVQEHLDSSPFAKICFTGHSLGGSLATLLLLMYRWRNVLPQDRAVVYTFGAPAVFCEGNSACGCGGTCGPCSTAMDGSHDEPYNQGLLASVGVKATDVSNVLMHRDIVPRAFACDYSTVAEILKSWGPNFREHCCLQGNPRSMLYNFVGTMMVLQPDQSLTWASSEPYHPMLPEGQELYTLSDPAVPMSLETTSGSAEEGNQRRKIRSVQEAILELMDNPHLLEILYDTSSYGPNGAISRYHNPDNYSRALGTLIHHKRTTARHLPATARPQHAYTSPQPSTPEAAPTSTEATPEEHTSGSTGTTSVNPMQARSEAQEGVPSGTPRGGASRASMGATFEASTTSETQGSAPAESSETEVTRLDVGESVDMVDGMGASLVDFAPPQLTEDVGTEKVEVADPEVAVEGKWLAASRLPFFIHARPHILWPDSGNKGCK